MLKSWKALSVFTVLALAAGLGPVIDPVLVSPVQADGWHIQTLTEAGSVSGDASIAIDSNGYPHIVCANSSGGALLYVSYNGSAWNVQTVTGTDNV